ncbi:MAG: zinc metalloprotease ZmpB [Frankiaceae bacterium]|nr:zinc metalloprotease ZmpB [Frankiaceae bacterium]
MFQTLDHNVDAYINHDDRSSPREILHHKPIASSNATAEAAASDYLRTHGHLLGLPGTGGLTDASSGPYGFQRESERTLFDSTTVSFEQTYEGIPVWRCGAAVHLRTEPLRVVSARSTARDDISLHRPSEAKIKKHLAQEGAHILEAMGIEAIDPQETADGKREGRRRVTVLRRRTVIFRYDEKTRIRRGSESVLRLAPMPDAIEHGMDRVAVESTVQVGAGERSLVWLVITDVETGAVLYIEPFVDDINGLVFDRDPITTSGVAANGPAATAATLNPLRSSVTLLDLTAPAPGSNQALTGTNVAITDFEPATSAPPTEPSGTNFDFDSRTDGFAAVNAYYHCDQVFRMIADLGFPLGTYFDGTTRPVPVDHRGRYGSLDGIERNASCSGNGLGGILNVDFELADLGDTAHPIGIAGDWRVVLHELCGHGILYESVNTANLGFSHSAGDSFAVILNDPDTAAADRFESFPWVSFIGRRHDRSIGGGWAWGGTQDGKGYDSEQILATSNFRAYLSIGGGSADPGTRRYAARVMAYLMLRGIATLTPSTNPTNASGFVTALQTADLGDWTSEGLSGGAYGKVIRWAFEKQGLFQAPGAPTPVTQEGAPPPVDVYIDDGRHGEYQYQPNHWSNQSVWNRRSPDGGTLHEEPVVNQTNQAYVYLRNRGTQTATGVVVKAFHCKPGAGMVWPNDWATMSTAQLSAPDIPPGGEVKVGPFAWTPTALGHECMLMVASAVGDPSNIDNFTAGDSIPEWRLVPHDNNIGQRNVAPVAAGGVDGLIAALKNRPFTVHNPFPHDAGMDLRVDLPSVLAQADWRVQVTSPGGSSFKLAAGHERDVRFELIAGSRDALRRLADIPEDERNLVITVTANQRIIGGMTYALRPDRRGDRDDDRDRDRNRDRDRDRDRGRDDDHDSSRAENSQADHLVRGLVRELGRVREVRISKVMLEVEFDDD